MTSLSPLIVAFYGGPGTGKSTTAALVFGQLKQLGYNVELVPEVAKDLTWEERHYALSHQAYIAAKQMRNYDRLTGKVDAIITDTSTLLSLVYGAATGTTENLAFREWIKADWDTRRTLNIRLLRDPRVDYNPAGRRQSESEAVALDARVTDLIQNLPGFTAHVDRIDSTHIGLILNRVRKELDGA